MSLVAAIPAAVLAVVAIMAFVRHTENMGTLLLVVNGGATLIGVLVALLPVIILVGKRRSSETDEAEPAAVGAESGTPSAQTAEVVPDGGVAPSDSDFVAAAEPAETDAFEFNADEFEDADSGESFEFEDEENA
jgi:hypothetical protein